MNRCVNINPLRGGCVPVRHVEDSDLLRRLTTIPGSFGFLLNFLAHLLYVLAGTMCGALAAGSGHNKQRDGKHGENEGFEVLFHK